MGESGGSAERKATELAAAGDATAGAWAAGAEGERLTAEALKGLGPTWVVLHDRLLFPGVTDSNVDHVVLGPGGIFVIDTKNRAGDISVYENGLYQHMFSASGDRVTKSMQGELGKVTWTAQEMSKRLGVTVVPVICLAGARSKNQKGVNFVQDVTVVGVQQLVGWLLAQAPRMPGSALAAWATRAMTEFPSTTTDPELLGAMAPAMRQHYLDRGYASGAGASPPRQARGRRPRRRPTRPRRSANARPASVVPRAPSPTTTRPKSERSPRQRGSCLRPLLQAMAGVVAAVCVLAFPPTDWRISKPHVVQPNCESLLIGRRWTGIRDTDSGLFNDRDRRSARHEQLQTGRAAQAGLLMEHPVAGGRLGLCPRRVPHERCCRGVCVECHPHSPGDGQVTGHPEHRDSRRDHDPRG